MLRAEDEACTELLGDPHAIAKSLASSLHDLLDPCHLYCQVGNLSIKGPT